MKPVFVKCFILLSGVTVGGSSMCADASDNYSAPISYQKDITTYSVNKDASFKYEDESDLLPSFSTGLNLVKSVLEKENGLEEAIYRRTDHWIFEAG